MITALQNTTSLEHVRSFDPTFESQKMEKPVGGPGDVVTISRPDLMTDEESEAVMANVQETIAESPMDALSVHSGLDFSRVMALLADD